MELQTLSLLCVGADNQARSSARATSAFNAGAISPALGVSLLDHNSFSK